MSEETQNSVDFGFEDFEDTFSKAEVKENKTPDEIPNGPYVVKVHKAEFAKSSTGLKMFKTQLVVASGKHKGRYLFMNNLLEDKEHKANEMGLKIIKGFLVTTGLKGVSLKEAASRLGEILDVHLEVNKVAQKNDPTRYNLYVNAKVDAPTADDEPVGVSSADVPF